MSTLPLFSPALQSPIGYTPLTSDQLTYRRLHPRIQRKIQIAENGCWNWLGAKYLGYGRLTFKSEKGSAHRIVYKLLVGPIPEGLELDHLCHNPSCVNPEHLEPVTRAENIRRSHTIGFGNGTRTACRRGHPFTEDNIYSWRGKRFCLKCQGIRQRAWLQRKAAA